MKRYRTELIGRPRPGDDKFFGDVDTQGIIDTVLYADPKSGAYTIHFAKTLKGSTLLDTCRNIWEFVKTQIPYVLDKTGYQWIKSPGRLWMEKSGDCKSFSVFTASCLKNLGITYGYRFASYDPNDKTPTHVYIYVPSADGEIIIDAVWTGPFNSQKPYFYKIDYLMAKTHYLGADADHKPGQLKLTKPVDEITDAELDLLLIRQELEIKKSLAGITGIGQYDDALKTINHCIRNVDNPDMICAIGEALEEGYSIEDAISGIGASAKKTARKAARAEKKKATGKTGAGRLLQKVGKGLKKAGKAIVKVVTAPVRLIAKGAMELYLPKAAPFFLYLFAPNPDTLPDLMKKKRKKAEKLKNFVVKGLGMKEAHFMKIVSNGFLKKMGKEPAPYLAEKLKTRVSGIGNPKSNWRNQCDIAIAGIGKPGKGGVAPKRKQVKAKPKALKTKARPNLNTTMKSQIAPATALMSRSLAPNLANLQAQAEENRQAALEQQQQDKSERKAKNLDAATNVASSLATGNIIGAVISAISWLISKISGASKGEKMEPITANDFPDVERDAANAFEYQDLTQDYSNLNVQQKDTVKEVATDLITSLVRPASGGYDTSGIENKVTEFVQQKLPFLNQAQQQEITEEVLEGEEAIDYSEGAKLANQIDTSGTDGESGNGMSTGLIAVAAVAALAIAAK